MGQEMLYFQNLLKTLSLIFYGPLYNKCLPIHIFFGWWLLGYCQNLPAYNFNESVPQNSLTNQKLFFTFSLLLIGRICCSSLFPMAKGEAVGVVERQLVFHFVYYKGYRRNLTVLV